MVYFRCRWVGHKKKWQCEAFKNEELKKVELFDSEIEMATWMRGYRDAGSTS